MGEGVAGSVPSQGVLGCRVLRLVTAGRAHPLSAAGSALAAAQEQD